MIGATLSDRAAVSNEGILADMAAVSGLNMIWGPLEPGRDLREQLKPLASQRGFEESEACDVPARGVKSRDDAAGDGIGCGRKDDRDRPRVMHALCVMRSTRFRHAFRKKLPHHRQRSNK